LTRLMRFAPGGLWRHPDFVKLWSAETISQFGTQVSFLAIPLVALLVLKASAFEVALISTIEFLPFILFTLPAGVWIDRMRRRPVLIVGDVGRAVSLLSIPVAYALGVLSIYQLYVVGFINGVLTVFFDVAWQSYLPSLVERDDIVEGNAKLEVSRSAAQIGGPGLGGLLVDLISAPLAIVADALSFAGSALFLFAIRKKEPPPQTHVADGGEPAGGMRVELAEGLRYVLGHPLIRPIAASTGTFNLFGNLIFAIIIVYFVRELGLDPTAIGLIFGVGNVGAIIGAVLASRVARWIGVGRAILGTIAISGAGALLVPLAPRENPIPFLVVSGLLGSFATVVYNVNQVSLRQAITPDRLQGRLNATMRFIGWGTIPIGSLLGGVLASTIGLLPTIWVGTIGLLLPVIPVLFSPVRSLWEIPAFAAGPVDEPAEPPEVSRPPSRE
jgi:MFS family permease